MDSRTRSFTSVNATIKASLEQAIATLLTPRRNIDILKEALAAKKQGRVYSVAFIGVNGVGKSTSLAKTAYYLKTKGKRGNPVTRAVVEKSPLFFPFYHL